MLADPNPHLLVGQPESQGAVFERHPRRRDFLPVGVTEFFELLEGCSGLLFSRAN